MTSFNEYNNIVYKYYNRIIKEKHVSIEEVNLDDKTMYSIKFYQPEWFTELDDDLKYNIIISIKNHYSQLISNLINSDNSNITRKRKHQQICTSNHCNCHSDSD
tara:strand:+ start:491 stop:802 length:312 start_codon:yes stop_codon:yes gene_type:complete